MWQVWLIPRLVHRVALAHAVFVPADIHRSNASGTIHDKNNDIPVEYGSVPLTEDAPPSWRLRFAIALWTYLVLSLASWENDENFVIKVEK